MTLLIGTFMSKDEFARIFFLDFHLSFFSKIDVGFNTSIYSIILGKEVN